MEKKLKRGTMIKIKLVPLIETKKRGDFYFPKVNIYSVKIQEGDKLIEFRTPKSNIWKSIQREVSL